MKYSIIEDIFLGNRGNGEFIKQSDETVKLNSKSYEMYENLSKTLNGEQKKQLDNLLNAEGDIDAETAMTHFKEGLKIGLLLLCEALQD